jgi:fructose-bisphosphate aldolase, class II
MTLAVIDDIVGPARAAGRGVGAFNVIGIEHAEAIVAGAEAAAAPVVLQISENCVAYHRGLTAIGAACLALARGAAVPVAVHLDHASQVALVEAAAELGLGSVMFDASRLPYADNVRATADVVRWCHRRGIWVEAELGEIGGKDGVHSPLARTDPGDAAGFVAATGVDALAVAVGSSHAMATRDAVLDLGLIARLHAAVSVPLVLHGSSGVPDRDLTAAVRAGMTKVNIATQLNKVFTAAVRLVLSADPAMSDPRKYGTAGRDAIASEVTRLLRLLATGHNAHDAMNETAGPRDPAADTGVRAGGAGEPLSPVE